MPPDDRVAAGRRRLERLWRAGTAFLGSELAIMGGAMTWVSEHRLVAALSDAGGFGVIACGAMEPDQLAADLVRTMSEIRTQRRNLDGKRREQTVLREQFAADLQRYRELKGSRR